MTGHRTAAPGRDQDGGRDERSWNVGQPIPRSRSREDPISGQVRYTRDAVEILAGGVIACTPTPPTGSGWAICDTTKDRFTGWRRVA